MKPKLITFVWQHMTNHTINTLQWKTNRRTTMQAWEDAVLFLLDRDPWSDPQHLLTFKGLPLVMDDSAPLRNPTNAEIKQLIIEANP